MCVANPGPITSQLTTEDGYLLLDLIVIFVDV